MAANGESVQLFLTSRRQDLRRIAVNFMNSDDQGQLLARLYVRLVRYADKSVRYAVKLDRHWDSEDPDSAAGALARLLTAPDQFDPMALIQYSYSQAAAYVILLHRLDWDLANLADHLRIADHDRRATQQRAMLNQTRPPATLILDGPHGLGAARVVATLSSIRPPLRGAGAPPWPAPFALGVITPNIRRPLDSPHHHAPAS